MTSTAVRLKAQLVGTIGVKSRAPGYRRRLAFVAICLTPMLALFTLFSFIPIGMAIWLSLHHYDQLAAVSPFLGLKNYQYAFTQDALFLQTLGNTLKYVVVAVPLNIAISLPIALGLNHLKRLRALFRTSFFMPTVASAVAVSLVWLPIYDPQAGWLNALLTRLNHSTVSWLADPATALWAVLVAAVWQDLGYNVIIFLAGLQSIPNEFYDAAMVDGAGAWARLRSITLPLLRRTFVFVLTLTTISYMQEFTHIQVMTGGGPVNSSESLVLYIYLTAFQDFRMGYASAMSVVLLLIILGVTLLQLWLLRQRWEY